MRRSLTAALFAATLLASCSPRARTHESPAAFVGEAACARCHAAEARAWRGSHHDRAMQPATDSTVLGDFRDATFRYAGVTSRFFRKGGTFTVRTDGADGALADFEVRYTFGVDPLQQYLIALPGGRLQALGIAWDTRPRDQGGQRWFHLYPGQNVTHDDELHWTRGTQNWNLQCAACHSTDLHKNYDASARTYHTKWSELNVACEACHGPGSRHVRWAERAGVRDAARRGPNAAGMGLLVALDERNGIGWTRGSDDLPRRSAPRGTQNEIEACARCHSSRTRQFDDDPAGSPLLGAHLPALLTPGLYHADGQVEGEVYEYGSFLQSRMYHEGVTCSDCHEPHRLALRAEGNALCGQCHDGARYDSPGHHHHANGSAAARCVTCHMPSHTFMVVDVRHDHSFRVPRPDLSDSLGTPNVCASCHANQAPGWAAARIRAWSGQDPQSFQQFAGALSSGRRAAPDAPQQLAAFATDSGQPAIARATALASLGDVGGPVPSETLRRALADPDPLLRLGAIEAAAHLPEGPRVEALSAVIGDSLRVLRALAAGALAGVPAERFPVAIRPALLRAQSDYVAGEFENADQPFAQVNLGNFYLARGDPGTAEQSFRRAIELDPDWIPAYVNLADLLRATNRDGEGESVLRAGLLRQPGAASLHHSLGLLLVRQKRMKEALESLGRASQLAPDDSRFAFVYAVGLEDAGRMKEALAVTERALARRPGDRDLTELWIRLKSGGASP